MFAQKNQVVVGQQKTLFSKVFGFVTKGRPLAGHQPVNVVENSQAVEKAAANITTNCVEGQVPVTIMRLCGPLNAGSYLDLIAKAEAIYRAGGRHILLDLSDVPSVGISSLVALHGIAAILRGEQPLDPQEGWETLRAASRDVAEWGMQPQFKLLNPQPKVKQSLIESGFGNFLQIHTDLETAIGSF